MPAGDNEKKFRNFMYDHFGDVLTDKKTENGRCSFSYNFSSANKDDSVYISYDDKIQTTSHTVLVEIDSNNYAKLIAGQYALINCFPQDLGGTATTCFVAIHFFGLGTPNEYSPVRTLKNLAFVANRLKIADPLPFCAFTWTEFMKQAELCQGDVEILAERLHQKAKEQTAAYLRMVEEILEN